MPATGSPSGAAPLTVRPYGDAGLLVDVASDDPATRWSVAQDLAATLLADPPVGLVDVVAAYEAAFVTFDPLVTDHDTLAPALVERSHRRNPPRPPRDFEVPVCYGGTYGPDLEAVAAELGLDPAALVALHTGSPWTVRFRGSPVGAPFLDGPGLPGAVSRNPTPRVRVEPGAVGLSGRQSMIYPVVSPGGWRLVGRTPLRLADPTRPGLVPYRPGDRFRFVAVDADAWAGLEGHGLWS